ncbi:hypothetical protein LINPERHAP1_LOCUS9482 [Linum perenne]
MRTVHHHYTIPLTTTTQPFSTHINKHVFIAHIHNSRHQSTR